MHDGAIMERFGFYFDDGEEICYWVNHVYLGPICMRCIELIYPPDLGARRRKFVPRGPVECSQLGLTEAEVTRRVALTAKGLAKYKELCERQRSGGESGGPPDLA
ncbi:MAG: hypothetical protein ACRDTA_11075 [Pseudonocardiaceae bacterium]